jgi:hypothetical protein
MWLLKRLKEIEIVDYSEWDTKLPVEVELKKAFGLVPLYSKHKIPPIE